jgi:hypothetical protein
MCAIYVQVSEQFLGLGNLFATRAIPFKKQQCYCYYYLLLLHEKVRKTINATHTHCVRKKSKCAVFTYRFCFVYVLLYMLHKMNFNDYYTLHMVSIRYFVLSVRVKMSCATSPS